MRYGNRMTTAHLRAVLATFAVALLSACPDDSVTHTRIAKTNEGPAVPATPPPRAAPMAAPPMAPPAGNAGMGAMAGDVPPPPKPNGAAKLDWTLPKDWTQTLTGGVRYATLKPPVSGNLDVSVVELAGTAGGELPNVNRWRGQIGLPPLEPDALPQARKAIVSKAGTVSLYDFTGEGTQKSRLVAGLLSSSDNTWFFKMTGDADSVAKALPDFTRLLASLRAP